MSFLLDLQAAGDGAANAIDLKMVEAFALVMRHGSLTSAENASGVPKATLRRHLMRLESTLGVQLFVRTAGKPVPTEAARDFYANCTRLLGELQAGLEQASLAARELGGGERGHLSIVATSHLSTSYVNHVLRRYVQTHPEVVCHVDLVSDSSAAIGDDIDCYVCSVPRTDLELAARLLGRLTYRLYASEAYVDAHGAPATPGDLARHKLLVQDEQRGEISLRTGDGAWQALGQLKIAASSNDLWVVKTMAARDHGIALLPKFFVHGEVAAGSLQPILPQWEAPSLPVYCMYPRQRFMNRKLRAFIDMMVDSFGKIESCSYYLVGRASSAG
ncbi:LysR family transcriptional regulator [Cupriavidus necator]